MRPHDLTKLPAERPQSGQAATTLGGLAERLIQALDVAGNYSLSLGGNVTPVVIAEDVSDRGPDYAGRRFIASITAATAGVHTLAFKATATVRVDFYGASNSVADALNLRLKGWKQADPFTIATPSGIWTDARDQADLAPVVTGSSGVATPALQIVNARVGPSLNFYGTGRLILRAGSALLFNFTAAGQVGAWVHGVVLDP